MRFPVLWLLFCVAFVVVACRTPPTAQARPLSVTVSKESILYTQLTFEVTNLGEEDCHVKRYVVVWPDHRHEEKPGSPFVIPPHESIRRTISLPQMHPPPSPSDVSIPEIVCRLARKNQTPHRTR
jgi:hypothetical protein